MKPVLILAACCILGAAPSLLAAQPPASSQAEAPDDQASAQQPAADPQESDSSASPGQAQSADVDSMRRDESGPVDGVPAWVFTLWCVDESARPQLGWGVSRDHSAGYRSSGRSHEGTWTVESANDRGAIINVSIDGGTQRLSFRRDDPNDASRDVMNSAGRHFDRCGNINYNERF
jgi:hypothetical protein